MIEADGCQRHTLTINIAAPTFNASLTWVASVLAHESVHAALYPNAPAVHRTGGGARGQRLPAYGAEADLRSAKRDYIYVVLDGRPLRPERRWQIRLERLSTQELLVASPDSCNPSFYVGLAVGRCLATPAGRDHMWSLNLTLIPDGGSPIIAWRHEAAAGACGGARPRVLECQCRCRECHACD
jgi:hypothetical protein